MPSRNPYAKEQMTAHWKRLRALASILELKPSEVSYHFAELKRRGLIAKILKRNAVAIQAAKDYVISRRPSPATIEEMAAELPAPPRRIVRWSDTREFKAMLWAVRAIGDIDVARDAFERVVRALGRG